MNEIERIKALSNAFGVSGFEDDVVELARTQLQKSWNVREDRMRNAHITSKQTVQKGIRVHLDAHSDEVGFIIQAICPDGTMRFLPIGGWDPKNIVSNKVAIRNRLGEIVEGIVCSTPPHFMKNSAKGSPITFDELRIDVGARSSQEVISEYHIGIGSPLVPAVTCTYDESHGIFMGKAFDCRIGCAALIETLNESPLGTLSNTISATLSAQEEVGERGMMCAIHQITADVVICFEGCPADDTFEESYLIQSALKKGVMLRHFDISMITHPRFQRYALDIAHRYQIPVQESVRKGGGTNGGITHTAYQGIPTIVIGIPVRYAHASYGICAWEDYRGAIELAKHIIQDLDADILATL